MSLIARVARSLTLVLLLGATVMPAAQAQPAAASQAPSTTAAQEEYVPIAELPDSEKLPAAPFLISAYVIVWGALLLYVWTLWKRFWRAPTSADDVTRWCLRVVHRSHRCRSIRKQEPDTARAGLAPSRSSLHLSKVVQQVRFSGGGGRQRKAMRTADERAEFRGRGSVGREREVGTS